MKNLKIQNLLSLEFKKSFCSLIERRTLDIPAIDISDFKSNPESCKQLVECFEKYGVVVIKDPRVEESKNSEFLDVMEKYYETVSQDFYNGYDLDDTRPESGHNIGVVPEGFEIARNHSETIKRNFSKERPLTQQPPPRDKKWRFAWNVGLYDEYGEGISGENVIPKNFPNWEEKMNSWGFLMKDSVFTVSEMLARGYGMSPDTFTSKMEGGCQLLAPTGSDLSRYNTEGEILAGFHYDLSFLTIHGKSRFPGLYIWLKDGRRYSVRIPDGCLIIQAAKQLEILTGGRILAGFHEVVVSEDTLEAVEKAKEAKKSLWRVSSTMFSTINYRVVLEPLPKFADHESVEKYPPILCYDQVSQELHAIGLLQD